MRAMLKLSAAVLVLAAVVACSKKPEAPADAATPPADQASAPTPAAEAAPVDPEVAAKKRALDFALMEDAFKSDENGQWAVSAIASSTFASDKNDTKASWAPGQATGRPDTQSYGDDSRAWASKEQDAGIEWIDLSFERPVKATEIRIRQTYNPGAIAKIELIDDNGGKHEVFKGPDATVYAPSEIAWLNVTFPETKFTTKRVKITLATNTVSGWNEIDAVQLVGK